MTLRALALLGAVATVLLATACRPHGKASGSAIPPVSLAGYLRATEELSPPFMVQQRLKGKYGSEDAEIDCVVQLAEGKLSVLGLTPFGTRAFVIEQRGREVSFQKFVERDLPIDPANVLYDIHRVFFRGLAPLAADRAALPEDGSHEAQDHGDMVRETWQDGHVVERRFESLEGPANLVVVSFEGAPAPIIAPRVRLTNVAFGYTLEIETSEQQLLDHGYTLEVEAR